MGGGGGGGGRGGLGEGDRGGGDKSLRRNIRSVTFEELYYVMQRCII